MPDNNLLLIVESIGQPQLDIYVPACCSPVISYIQLGGIPLMTGIPTWLIAQISPFSILIQLYGPIMECFFLFFLW